MGESGGGGDFPRTTWGMVLGLAGEKTAPEAVDALCRRYWDPIFRYVRAALARTDDDARDLTQEFFLWLLEDPVLRRYEASRGSFRNFLKGVLRNFGRHREEAARRLKRGGGKKAVPLDSGVADLRPVEDADAVFDRAFKEKLLERAFERVKASSKTEVAALQWRAFCEYDLVAEEKRPTYAELAARLGRKESDVRNYLHAARERVRAAAREELTDTVGTAQDLDDEWRRLFEL